MTNFCNSLVNRDYTNAICHERDTHEARFADGSIGWYCDTHILNAIRNGAFVSVGTFAHIAKALELTFGA